MKEFEAVITVAVSAESLEEARRKWPDALVARVSRVKFGVVEPAEVSG